MPGEIVMLDHEKLVGYRCSNEFLAWAFEIVEKISRGYAMVADHIKRASISIPFNSAEGTGKTGKSDNKKFYAIARGSAMECGAVLDTCLTLKLIETHLYKRGKIYCFE